MTAAGADIDFDIDLAAAQIVGGLRRQMIVRLTFVEEHDRSNAHHRGIERERHARAPGRRDEPSPVGIAAVDGGFHQRRVGDDPRCRPGLLR